MKKLIIILIGCIALLSACKKTITSQKFPAIGGESITSLSASQLAWLAQITKQKQDSIRIVDSLIAIGKVIDTTSLLRKKNMMVAVVEANTNYLANPIFYVDTKGKPVFDLIYGFSANMHYNTTENKAFVFYNDEWTRMNQSGLYNYIKKAGVKLGLCLLPDHDGASFDCFDTKAKAVDFATKVAFEVRSKHYDALLVDEEWDEKAPFYANSYVMVVSEMRKLMPDIFFGFYDIGGGSGTYEGKQMGDVCDADFESSYSGKPNFSNIFNFPKQKCFSSLNEGGGNAVSVKSYIDQGARGVFYYNAQGLLGRAAYYDPFVKLIKGADRALANYNSIESHFVIYADDHFVNSTIH